MFESFKAKKERKDAQKDFQERVKFNQQKNQVDVFCTECKNNVTDTRTEIGDLEDQIMQAFAAGDEDEAEILCGDLSFAKRQLEIWRVIYKKARQAQSAIKQMEGMKKLGIIMDEMNQIMNVARDPVKMIGITQNLNNMDYYNNVMDTIVQEARQASNTTESKELFKEMREKFEKRASLDDISVPGASNDVRSDRYRNNQ